MTVELIVPQVNCVTACGTKIERLAYPHNVKVSCQMSDSEQVLDFSPEPPAQQRTRSLVVELLVRQALAGEDWQTKSANLIQTHNIDPDEVERELAKRKDRRSGRSEPGSQRRARVLTEVLREMPADAPREEIVAAFKTRYSQPDRRRSNDKPQTAAADAPTTPETAVEPTPQPQAESSSNIASAAAPSASAGNQETKADENKKPWWKRVMFWIK